ncbi:hypothetical protein FJT64_015265 [Amphibalanus amphitrite]|uniref:Uncharacterized protein n=1 Tax=Amphibalanus amphitrite TaxID=1232801 RepID=A0A6A4X3K0_AMPAM|nr:hypothetical protein FJT64_015265 [Amphibalanus amphitrite]
MTRRGALLLLVVLTVGVGAPPSGIVPPDGNYQCCQDASAQFLSTPKDVVKLDQCKKFCETNEYGSPVFLKGAWLCAPTAGYKCSGVAKSFCESSFASIAGYFRLYPQSFFITRKEESLRKSSGSDTIATDTVTKDTTIRDRALIGGSVRDIRKEEGIRKVDIGVTREGLLGTTRLTGQTREFGGGQSTIIGDRLQINVGRTGSANLTQTIGITGRNTSSVIGTNLRVDTASDGSQELRGPNGDRSVLTRVADGTTLTDGRDVNNRRIVSNINRTSVSVRGDAQGPSGSLLGEKAGDISGIGDITRNVDTTVTRGRGVINNSGSGRRDIERQGRETTARLDQTRGGAQLRTETVDVGGTTSQSSRSGGQAVINTDAVTVSKEGVGSITQEKNNTIGNQGNTTQTTDTEEKLVKRTQNTECKNCASSGTEVTLSKDLKGQLVVANSEFDDTTVKTSTVAGGKRLDLVGRTRTELNGTMLNEEAMGGSTTERTSKVEAGCDKKVGGCNLVTQSSGTTSVQSRNTTEDKDNVETKTSVVSVTSFG